MRSILYFTLLFIVFGSSNLFAVEQLEGKKIDVGESVGSVHEDVGIEKDLKQDLPHKLIQQENELEFSKSDIDELNIEKTQDTKTEQAADKEELKHNENEISTVEKVINEKGARDKDFDNNLPEESKNEVTPSPPSVTDKEMNKNLALSPSVGLDENATDLQKDLQVDRRVDVKENQPSENSANKLSEEKKANGQIEKEEVEKSAEDRDEKNQIKPIAEKGKQEEKKNLQEWTKLNRESIKEWYHQNAQSKSIYKRQYDNFNEHLPATVFVDDYSKQFFYCIKKNNLVCLRGMMGKLEKLGLTVQEVLKLRNKFGDTPLIYAVKRGEIDIVRFLLLQGADPKVVNNSFQSSIDIAVEKGRSDMVNAIAEMIPYLSNYKKIDNKEGLKMYDWAVKTKEDNELQCNEEDD
ncbi:ankyrin repeat domain-containing protein [Wolbachia endosymbiont of Ctenocephalides felis wCfeJ]|uniref:ankyrin repeat domain-containing protein n=1 Tax=Wolbachia endosymbiont of Ctenocephalides felis wCfeJ TaxID=2732594 RepID=UPI001446C154|nr:ankyrin repeat domain-containing protein [Wolbachia endosymbiont of Ctenocephalides felis wCfeJ]WCR57716.1 MAG: hypothetical protein PG980_000188 [Wolbachia endosymbiont of Ctenocephalides felis wCfeJ]